MITLIGVGIRLLTQVTIQQRRERMNRQINERLRALMAAYKTLGGSFTGDLTVDPAHRRDLRQHSVKSTNLKAPSLNLGTAELPGSDRARRVRDAVEAALSDIILLGTEEQVRLAASAANQLVTGQLVQTQELVVSLRAFIREALDLEAIPAGLSLPLQGPARLTGSGGGGKAEKSEDHSSKGGGMGSGGGVGGGGMGGEIGAGSNHQRNREEEDATDTSLHHS